MFEQTHSSAFQISRWFFFLGVLLIAQTTWRPALAFTLSDWIFLAAVLFAFPILWQAPVKVPIPKMVLIGLGLVLLGGLLSTPGAKWPLSSLFSLLKMCYLVAIWFSVGTILLRRTEDVQKAMQFWAISACVTSAAAAAQLIWGDIIPGTSPVWGRMTGFAEHVNDLGGITSIALVPALYIATLVGQSTWLSWASWGMACLILSGLVWSGSLSGILAASVGLIIWMVLNKGGLKQVLVLIVGSGAIVVLVHLISTAVPEVPETMVAKIERPSTPTLGAEKATSEEVKVDKAKAEETKVEEVKTEPKTLKGTEIEETKIEKAKVESEISEKVKTETALMKEEKADEALIEMSKVYRVKRDEPPMLVARLIQLKEKTLDFETLKLRFKYYQTTWESIAKNFFVGVGVGHWNGSHETGQLVHNLYLGSWYEGGLLAFLGILVLLGSIGKSGMEVIQSPVWEIRLMGVSLFSAFCVFLILGLAQPIYYKRFQWLPALFILALYSIEKPQRKKV